MLKYLSFYAFIGVLSSFKLWAPSYSYSIRDSEFDYYDTASYNVTLKNLNRKDQAFDICVESKYPKAPYVSVKLSEIHKPVSKKLERIISPVKHKVLLGAENQSSELNGQKLGLTNNFTTKEIVIPFEEVMEAMSSMADGEVCLAHFEERGDGAILLLTKVKSLETLKLEIPVEIIK